MVNKGDHDAKAKKIGTGAGSAPGIKSYTRGAKSYRSR
jgi:hypothetical protein